MSVNKSIAPGGGTRHAVGIQKDSTSQEKKVSTSAIREKRLLVLQEENDTIYRLEHGLPVSWRG